MVTEHDLESLEALLDDELPELDMDALRRRVASDPELAATFEAIRAQRSLRQQHWQALEPRDADVATLVSTVRSTIRKQELWAGRQRVIRYVSGLAACITLGFLVGRYVPYGSLSDPDRGTGVVFQPAPGAMQEVTFRPSQNGYKVLLTDGNGRVIAEQPFRTFDEAREFTEDLGRLQNQSRGVRPMRVSDTIYTKDQF
jgi:hypothetical protein